MSGRAKLGMAVIGVALGILALSPQLANAVPTLQLYIEGSTYDSVSESWVFTAMDNTLKLWVLGDVGSYGTIHDVKLTAAFDPNADDPGPATITITSTTASAGQLPSPGDTSTPAAPTLVANPSSAFTSSSPCGNNGTVMTIPCLGDGSPLAKHGEYGPTQWVEWALGDFTLTDSPIGDYITVAPDPLDPSQFPKTGQINAYKIEVAGFDPGTVIHFDAFNHVVLHSGKTKFVFAPFSHDAVDAPPLPPQEVPEPSMIVLVGSGLGLLAARAFKRARAK